MFRGPAILSTAMLLTAAGPPAAAADRPERELRTRWVGAWVVLRTEAFSNCDGSYTNVRVRGSFADSRGDYRFEPGELARVDNLHLRRARIDLLVGVAEPLRVAWREGPFELYEQRDCRVELRIEAPRSAVRKGEMERLDELIGGVVEPHDSRPAALASPLCNRRRVEPLPADYEETLAAYRDWRAEQLHHGLHDRLAEALDRSAQIAGRGRTGVAYARGLLLGAEEQADNRRYSQAPCEELVTASFQPRHRRAPDGLDDDEADDWTDGFRDGQVLVFELELAKRLERCLR